MSVSFMGGWVRVVSGPVGETQGHRGRVGIRHGASQSSAIEGRPRSGGEPMGERRKGGTEPSTV